MKKELPKVKYKHANKHNTNYDQVTKAPCRYCLEQSTFRVTSINGVNHLTCTRCLKSCRFNKKFKPIQHPIIKVTHFTTQDYITRTWYRIKRWFTGDHVRGRFGRRRKK